MMAAILEGSCWAGEVVEWSQNQRDCLKERRWDVANTTDLQYREGVRIVGLWEGLLFCKTSWSGSGSGSVVWDTKAGVGL